MNILCRKGQPGNFRRRNQVCFVIDRRIRPEKGLERLPLPGQIHHGIRLAAQVEVMMGWHKLQDRRWDELPLRSQLFRAVDHALLRRAYESEYRAEFTDDASVVEANGEQVTLCEGERTNIKITSPADLLIARILRHAGDGKETDSL